MNRILLSALLMTVVTVAKAQIPQQLNYQGIARNASGKPITYQDIKVRISLIDSAGGGYLAYRETRTVKTNYVGLFNIVIGAPGASNAAGRMQDVNWITGRKYIKLEIDPTGSSNFILAGITQLQSVPYALSAATAGASGDAHGDLTGTYPSPVIAHGVITNTKLADGSVSMLKLEASVASTLTSKVNASDTAAMLSPYAKKSEIGVSQAGKLNISDTAVMLSPYQNTIADLGTGKLNVSDTASMLGGYYPAATAAAALNDITTSVSDLNTSKLNLSDTAAMLSPYQNTIADLGTGKLNVSDTAAMLGGYYPAATAAAALTDITTSVSDLNTGKLNLSDTTAMLSPYQNTIADLGTGKLNVSDTAAMLSPYAIKTDVAAQVAAAAPAFETGTLGNDFNISSSGPLYTFNLPDASDTSKGLITITDQVFKGTKTFTSDLIVNGITIGNGLGQGGQNTAIGREALGSGTGSRNTAVGYIAMHSYSGTSFDNNSSVGYANMLSLTTGNANTSVGAEAMMSLTTGRDNTSIGQQSLINTTGDDNTALGSGAGHSLTLGNRNTFLGRASNASIGTLDNATAIGYFAIVDAPNKIQLGNTDVSAVNTSGRLTTGAVTYPNTDGNYGQVLTTDGAGLASWSAASVREAADEFDADPAQTEFTLSAAPAASSKVKMYVNGIRISNKAYTITGTTLTYNPADNGSYSLTAADRIQLDYTY